MIIASLRFLALAGLVMYRAPLGKSEASQDEDDEKVVSDLSPKEHDEFISSNDNVMVLYHAPWCGHCKAMMPNYMEAAKRLRKEGNETKLGKLDAHKNAEVAARLEIRGYPTMIFYKKGQKLDYEGGRTTDDIVSWILGMTGSPLTIATDIEETRPTTTGVAHFLLSAPKDSEEAQNYYKVADNNRGSAKFFQIESTTVSLKAMRHGEDDATMEGSVTVESIEQFIKEENIPLFGPISPENYKKYFAKEWPIAWACGEPSWLEKLTPIFRQVAAKFRSRLSFVFLDSDSYRGHAVQNLDVKEYPALVIHGNSGRFVMKHSKNPEQSKIEDEILDVEKIEQFCNDALSGKLPKHYKSEDIPTEDEGAVQVVVGKTFENLVLNSESDVLLNIFAPWCDHCKKLAPALAEVAEAYKSQADIVVAKMDGAANEPPSDKFEIRGFPMIYWLKKGDNTPQLYDGPRTPEAMKEFVEQNRSKRAAAGVAKEVTHEEL